MKDAFGGEAVVKPDTLSCPILRPLRARSQPSAAATGQRVAAFGGVAVVKPDTPSFPILRPLRARSQPSAAATGQGVAADEERRLRSAAKPS